MRGRWTRLVFAAIPLALSCSPAPSERALGSAGQPLSLSDPLELDPAPRTGELASRNLALHVTNDGQNFLVGWADQRSVVSEIYETRISPAGALLDPYSVRSSRVSTIPDGFSFAAGGGQQLTVWQDLTAQLASATRGTLGALGQAPSGVDIVPPTTVAWAGTSTIWDGKAFDLALSRGNPGELAFVRIFADGGSSSASTIYPPGNAPHYVTGIASSAGVVGVSSVELASGSWAQHLTLVDPTSGAPLSSQIVSDSAGNYGRLAADGRGFVLAYNGQLGASLRVMLQRIPTDGGTFGDAGSDVTTDPSFEQPFGLDVLANGNLAVAVGTPAGTMVKEVAEDGGSFTTVSDVPVADAGFSSFPAMSCLGANCLVAWYSNDVTPLKAALYTQGGTMQPSFALKQNSRSQWSPKAAFAGGRYLVVWAETDTQSSEFYGRLIDEVGVALSPPLPLFAATALSPPLPGTFDLVSLGGRFLVLATSGSPATLQGRFVELDGGVGAPFDVMQTTSTFFGPAGVSAASIGDQALVVFGTYSTTGVPWEIRAARIAADGTVLDFNGFPVMSGSASPLLAVSPGANGFQIVWLTYAYFGNSTTLYTASVFPDGGGANETTTALLTMPGSQSQPSPALGFDGAHHYATWVDGANGTGHPAIRLLQFDEDGGVAVDGGETLSTPGANATPGEINCGANDCTVLYSELSGDAYQLRALQLSSDGGRRNFGSSLVTQTDDEVLPSSTPGDAGWLLTWARYHAAPYGSLRVASRVIDGPGSGLDAGSDAGSTDGGTDAGELDAGEIDAGEQDAGESIPPVRLHARVGCDCESAGSGSLFAFAFVASLVFARRRLDGGERRKATARNLRREQSEV